MVKRIFFGGLLVAGLAAQAAACSEGEGQEGGTGAGNASGGHTGTGAGTASGGGIGFGGNTASGGGGGDDTCAGETSVAEPIPLDLAIMLDASGSMLEKTGQQGTGAVKWDAITSALGDFFLDDTSVGIGVGLQFFPLKWPDAPDSCSTSAQCGAYGPCILKICQAGGTVCDSSQDCGPGDSCINLGQCQNQPGTLCLPIGAYCPGNQGQCVQVTSSVCLNTDSCDAAQYADPAVPIATLQGVEPALSAAIAAQSPEGGTPTSAALQGAIDYAQDWASSHPDHTVAVLLATDGEPTACDPLDAAGISAIAAAAAAADPPVATFVIGIIENNNQTARDLLDDVAAAGATQQAYIVDPQSQNVGQDFLLALEAIRGSALACEYAIPQPGEGETIDYLQINVEHTPPGESTPDTVYYVGDAASCDPDLGGWYYDVDPQQGEPTKILVCPATCDLFGAGGTVSIRVHCATVVAPPR